MVCERLCKSIAKNPGNLFKSLAIFKPELKKPIDFKRLICYKDVPC
jgi:hypothetical protein